MSATFFCHTIKTSIADRHIHTPTAAITWACDHFRLSYLPTAGVEAAMIKDITVFRRDDDGYDITIDAVYEQTNHQHYEGTVWPITGTQHVESRDKSLREEIAHLEQMIQAYRDDTTTEITQKFEDIERTTDRQVEITLSARNFATEDYVSGKIDDIVDERLEAYVTKAALRDL